MKAPNTSAPAELSPAQLSPAETITVARLAEMVGGAAVPALAAAIVRGDLAIDPAAEPVRAALMQAPVTRAAVTRWVVLSNVVYPRSSALGLWVDGPAPANVLDGALL